MLLTIPDFQIGKFWKVMPLCEEGERAETMQIIWVASPS